MALRAQQPQFEPQPQPQHDQKKKHEPKPARKFGWFHVTPGEKGLIALFCIALAFVGILNLNAHSAVQETNIAISKTEDQINTISDENEELYVQVSELSRYERIWERAQQLGLTQNEENVRVVSGQ